MCSVCNALQLLNVLFVSIFPGPGREENLALNNKNMLYFIFPQKERQP